MKISVITATYNRGDLLKNLYESINRQHYKNIEWIIIDDGSSDNTKEIVSNWQNKSDYEIVYKYQENQGKMQAINNGIKYVTGDIIIEVDSDDYFMDDVFETIENDYKNIPENAYGIIYLNHLIGHKFSVDRTLDNKVYKLFDIHNKYGYDFDMHLTFKADVRKKYNYRLENNEKFVTEARLYYQMDQDYEGLLFKNKEITVCEYMPDGYTKNIKNMFLKYPFGYYNFFKESLNYKNRGILFKKRLYLIKHYILFCYLTNKTKLNCIKNVYGINRLFTILLVIPGYIKSKKFR